jgi:hypothetical protein
MPAVRRCRLPSALIFAIAAAYGLPADATVLYKSIGPNGVIQFSDTPPESGVVVETRIVDGRSDGAPVVGTMDGLGLFGFENPLELAADNGLALDDALAKANAQVDLAEHALALARSSAWTRREGLRLQTWHRAQGEDARIDFYERNLAAARANLLALLNRGRTPFSLRRNGPPATQVADASLADRASTAFRQ